MIKDSIFSVFFVKAKFNLKSSLSSFPLEPLSDNPADLNFPISPECLKFSILTIACDKSMVGISKHAIMIILFISSN